MFSAAAALAAEAGMAGGTGGGRTVGGVRAHGCDRCGIGECCAGFHQEGEAQGVFQYPRRRSP